MLAMNDHGYAIDLYIGELARRSCTEATRIKYTEVLYEFADHMDRIGRPPWETTTNDCRTFLDTYTRSRPPLRGKTASRPPVSASTMGLYISIVRGYFAFLKDEVLIEENPMDPIKRPARKRPEDLPVVTTSSGDVARMFAACVEWDELLALATVCYLGPRRNAVAGLRRGDLDLEKGLARFREKGGKEIVKPIPDELLAIYLEAEQVGLWLSSRDYVIPNRRAPRSKERSNKVIYAIVKRLAERARVDAHPHSLRAAFAVQFDEQNPGHATALKELLGHSRIETTMTYLRRKDKAKAMEQVRSLSWSALRPSAGMPPAGFEPALREEEASMRAGTKHDVVLPDPLRRKLDELRSRGLGRIPR
jgi:integrase/recombinase XerD